MKKCPQCGTDLDDQQDFCTRCGAKLPEPTNATPPPQNQQATPPPPPAGAGAPPPPPSPTGTVGPQQPPPSSVPPQSGPAAPPKPTTHSAPPPPATPGPAAPPPPQSGGQSKWWIWLIVAIVVVGIIIGLVWWVSSATRNAVLEGGETFKKEMDKVATSVTATATPTATPRSTPTPTPTPTPVPLSGADTAVANFLNMTLGTLPTSNLNYDAAWAMLAPDLQAMYPDSSMLPMLLCIQDGPSDVSVDVYDSAGGMATVDVQANYGGTWMDMWQFELQEVGGEWQIVAVSCLNIQ